MNNKMNRQFYNIGVKYDKMLYETAPTMTYTCRLNKHQNYECELIWTDLIHIQSPQTAIRP